MAKPAKRKNGQGSITFEPDRKKYRAAITIDGERFRARFNTETEADEWLTIIRAESIKGTFVAPSEYTIGEWAVEYLKTYAADRVEPTTLQTYTITSKLLDPISKIKLKDLDAIKIQKFYNSFESISKKNRVHFLLRMIMNKAEQLRIIPYNPLKAVTPPKRQRSEIEIFSMDEIKKLLKFLKSSTRYSKYYLMCYLAVSTGLRESEIFALKPKAVRHGYLHIDCALKLINYRAIEGLPKGNRIRDVTIDDKLEAMLRKPNKGKVQPGPDDYIFKSQRNGAIRSSNFVRTWKSILKKAGISHKHFHALRHTHATQLLANGVPIHEVQKRLGHATPMQTLNTYGHCIKDFDKTIPNQVREIFAL